MNWEWGKRGGWSLRIVRKQGEAPMLWHIILDEIGDEIEVTQCSDGSGAWVDLSAADVAAGEPGRLSHLCWQCVNHFGWFAGICEEDARRR